MFADAYEKASSFTHPVIISTRYFDGTVNSGCGSFVIVNKEGWILTAKHIINSFLSFQAHAKEIGNYDAEVERIKQDSSLNAKQKRKKISKLRPNRKWITHHSFWWGKDNLQLEDKIYQLPYGDLICGKLTHYDPSMAKLYPVFKNPKSLRIGTSLCRLGFPLYEINAMFDETTNQFRLADGTLPLPRFPIEKPVTHTLSSQICSVI